MGRTPTRQLPQELVRELFEYRDGDLYWRVRPARRVDISNPAGGPTPLGYRRIGHDGWTYATHNLVWNYHYGDVPDGFTIDHIDRVRTNNDLSNLRLATSQQQAANRREYVLKKKTASGHRNVYWHSPTGRWTVQVSLGGKKTYVGLFDTIEEAVVARDAFVAEYRIKL